MRWSSEDYVVGQYDSVWRIRNGNASRVGYLYIKNIISDEEPVLGVFEILNIL